MRNITKIKFYKLSGVLTILLLATGCKKENTVVPATPELPVLANTTVTNITSTSAIIRGTIIYDGSDVIIQKGVCWNTATTQGLKENNTIDSKRPGSFDISMTNLTPNTTYTVSAYIANSAGPVFGMPVSFKTLEPGILILNDTIELIKNELGFNFENSISILFDSVFNDSRCPKGAYCWWAGNAEVRFIFTNNNNTTSFRLNTYGRYFGRVFLNTDSLISGYKIKLLNLSPYPDISGIKQEDYRARIIIIKE